MMTGAPQHIEIFVTHVAEDGPLLKIWGQLDRSAATFVERLILQYTEQFERGVGVVYPQALAVDQLCCAKYGEDGVYYRARIADLSAVQQGYVRVNFIDYGNSDVVEISNIRSLQLIATSPLCSVQNQATEFALAGVVPPMGVGWDQPSVDFIREKLCYAEFRCAIVAQMSGRRLITLYYHDTDFSEILIQKNLAIRITLHAQQAMFQNLQYQYSLSNSNTSSYSYSVPPPSAPVNYSSNANLLVKTASITKQESGVISAPVLSIGSKHVVYISNVEDGPNLFAVQLKATENILQNMTQTFSHVPLKPFQQSPIPGSACVSLLPQAKVLCRAVVTSLMEKECVVYCVDFGNTETVPFSQIYELPTQFLQTKSLAMRFCLAGLQNTTFDEKAKRLFQELVTGETLTLEVVEPEGPPLKQYGVIYINGKNILHVLKEKQREFEKSKAYPQLPAIQAGRVVNVTVSFVESLDNFYVQYEANVKPLQKIMSTMVDYCTNSAAMVRPNELYVGMPVCALFSADQQWYRARILSMAGDQITVFYVDYGNTDTVNLVSLRQMDSNLSQAQAQAVVCALSGYEGTGAAFEDLSNKFEEMTLERKLTMKIMNRLPNGKLIVELHNTSEGPVVNIAHQLTAPDKKSYEETPIDEWHDPAAAGEPAALQTKQAPLFGKDRSKLEDGSGEGWKGEAKRSNTWNESRDTSKKWGSRDDKSDRKWGRSDESGDQKRWGKEEQEVNSGWDDGEERGGNKKWEGADNKGNSEKNWERRGFNRDGGDWKERENKRFNRDDDWKEKENNKREFNKGDWKERDNNKRGFNKDDNWKSRDNKRGFGKDGDDWKDGDNKRGFGKDGDDWKDRDNKRGFGKDGDDWKDGDNKRGFSKDGDDWKDRDNKRGFGKDGNDWKDRDNKRGFGKNGDDWKDRDNKRGFGKDGDNWKDRDNRKFSRDNEDRNWRKRDDQGQDEKKWWGHDDRGEPEKKWGSREDGEGQRKWNGRENRNANTGEFKKWNNGDRGNRKNDTWKDQGAAASSENDWGTNTAVASAGDENWDDGTSTAAAGGSDRDSGAKAYSDVPITIGAKESVTLVSADDPTNFVIQADNRTDDLTKMMENISSVYESGGTVIPEDDQQVLLPCVTRYSEDNAWYRAVINNVPSNGETEVRFVDYGNHETVPSTDIKEVVPEFFSIPLFGISCSLFAVNVPVAEWSSDQVNEFLSLTDGKKLEAHFIKKEGTLFEVVLFDSEDLTLSINEKFGALKTSIEEGMSKKTFKAITPPKKAALSSFSFKQPAESEIVYASSEDSFASFEFTSEITDIVSVTWFINPGQFFCQRNSAKAEFISMVNDIQTAYKGRTPNKEELSVGCPVIAQFPADKVLYRAEIKEIKGLKYQVQYVDYGNMELLAPNNIWLIEKRFTQLPKQAIECSIRGISPVESEWPKDCADFDRLFGAESLECTFHGIEEGVNLVSLQANGKDVAEELVGNGLALHKVEEKGVSEERLALKLLKEQQILAHVSFIESASKFFVHLDPVVAKSVQDQVDKHVSENKDSSPIQQEDMVEHQMCLATPNGDQWYRGKIIDTSGTVGVCVSFVDFGDSDDIPVDKIRLLPQSLMGFRHQATECFVAGSESCEVGKDVEETFKVEVEAQDVILSIEDIVNERLSVHLFDIEGLRLEILKNVDTSSPLDVVPVCPLPILTHTVRMWVSHVEKLSEIWLQKESEADILSGLLDLLFNFYEEENKGVELGDPQADQLCAAKSSKDGSWYRAKVKDVTDEQITIVYIDYGNSETLPKGDVKELDQSFYRVHALSVCASLAFSSQDHETSLAEFQNITTDTTFDVSFVKDSEGKWLIQMENDETNVINYLVKAGMGSEMESHFHYEQISLPENEKIDVSISHFESSSEFWVQMDSNFLDILELQSTLQIISPSQAILSNVEVGTLCVAQFSDEAWYRAKVVEINEANAKVHFLDYGNAYETDVNSLRKLPIKFFHWPHFAVRCRLSNYSFLENEELSQKCSELLSDTEAVFQLQVVESNDPVLVSLFVGEKELEAAVIERKEAESNAAAIGPVESEVLESKTVFVSHVSSPAKFWVQREDASLELQNLADHLVQAVNFEPISDLQVGTVCAALFEDDEQWYRAKILELCEGSYNVLFVDYGNSSVVTDLRVLPEELVAKPFVAKCCQLQMPAGVECWSTEADKKFVELTGDGTETFLMTMFSEEEPCEVKLTYNGSDVSEILGQLCLSCAKAPSDGDLTATISHINNLSEFWIHWETESSKLDSVADKLVDAENFDPLQEFSDGLLCVAQFPDDEQWYRARITSCQEQSIEVSFIDYGNTALVTEVHSISEDLACIPPLAKRCSLPLPDGLEKWPEKAEGEFINIFGDGANTYKIKILQEDDPLVISLELNGTKIIDMLQKCCEGTVPPEESPRSSSTEVEILSETEVIIDSEAAFDEEKTDLVIEDSSSNLESEVCDPEVSAEIVKEIVEEMFENSLPVQAEQETTCDVQTSEVNMVPSEEMEEEMLSANGAENESPEAPEHGTNELVEMPATGEQEVEETENLDVPEEKSASVSDIPSCPLIDNNDTEISKHVSLDEENMKYKLAQIHTSEEEYETSKTALESSETPKTELMSPKKSEPTKQPVEHCEQIIRDFSVEMQMPGKMNLADGAQGAVCSSPVRKLSHAERIVPGSISRGLSPTELETSPEKSNKELQEHIEGTFKNMADCEASVDNGEVSVNNGDPNSLKDTEKASEDHKQFTNTHNSDDDGAVGSVDASDESRDKRTASFSSSEQKSVATAETNNADVEREADSTVLNESSSLSESPQKTDHDTSGSTINGSGNPTLDSSETNSVSTVSSSPQKDSQSTELETEMSGDISGSLYEDSDSSANCTLIDNNATEISKHVSVNEENMKYKLAQIHTSEEKYETSKTELESSITNATQKEITHTFQSEPGTSVVEERKD